MFRVLKSRLLQKHRTFKYPNGPAPQLPDRFLGRPVLSGRCPDGCRICADSCPYQAIAIRSRDETIGNSATMPVELDMGRCIFCGACARACPEGNIVFSSNWRLAAARREDLVVTSESPAEAECRSDVVCRYYRHSLKLRQVSAGGCNACEADSNVLGTPAWDMGRFGISFVASPRHADALLVTGPVSRNMKLALEKTFAALPAPKVVVACGTCTISGGPFAGHSEVEDGAESTVPIDLFIPGCPPHPLTILDALLRLQGIKTP